MTNLCYPLIEQFVQKMDRSATSVFYCNMYTDDVCYLGDRRKGILTLRCISVDELE